MSAYLFKAIGKIIPHKILETTFFDYKRVVEKLSANGYNPLFGSEATREQKHKVNTSKKEQLKYWIKKT